MSRRADLRPRRRDRHSGRAARCARLAAVVLAVAAAVLLPMVALALPTGESWGAPLGVAGGDDQNVAFVNGAVRLVAPSTTTTRSTGVLVLPPRRPSASTNAVTADLTADLPPGTAVAVDVRGIRSDGTWSAWVSAPVSGDGSPPPGPAVLPETTHEVQVRVRLLGGQGAVGPAVMRLWLTTSLTGASPTPASPTTGTSATPETPETPATTLPATTAPATSTVPVVPTDRPDAGASAPTGTTTSPATATTAAAPTRTTSPGASSSGSTSTGASSSGSTSTRASSTPAGASATSYLLWSADVTTRGLGGFTPTTGDVAGGDGGAPPTVGVVPATGLPGRKAIRTSVPAGGVRAEVRPATGDLTGGQDRWFRLSVRLAPGFPTGPGTPQVITRWKDREGDEAPLQVQVADGHFVLAGGGGHPGGAAPFSRVIAPAAVDRVVDLVVHVRFATDPTAGVVDVWSDGTPRITGYHPPGGTLAAASSGTPSSSWTIGISRDARTTAPAAMEISDARLGTDMAAVTAARP